MKKIIKFHKMHGAGNDYIYIDCVREQLDDPSAAAIKLSDRRFGIGGDGIILLCPSDCADFRMRMFNADGTEGRMCGNGIRCLAKFARDLGHADSDELDIETLSGIKHIRLLREDGKVTGATVDMGAPDFAPASLPVLTCAEELIEAPLTLDDGRRITGTCVSMGNPHCVVFTNDVDGFPLPDYGAVTEKAGVLFPEAVNFEIAAVLPDSSIRMRVWERGTGETWACGTGACAVLAAAVRSGRLTGRRSAVLHLRGGDLDIEWDAETGHIIMTGGAEFVFSGEVEI